MATKRRGDDDPAWSEPGIGGDTDKPKKMPGARANSGMVARIAEAFWRECDMVPLHVPRWGSRPRMNANVTYLLQRYSEDEILASFTFFRTETESLLLNREHPCWETYFRRRGLYLRSAIRAMEGRRKGEAVRKAGDITVDNERFHVREPGDAPHSATGDDALD